MEIKGDKYYFDDKTSARIQNLLPRLKNSILPSKIVKWLENFEENEINIAIDLLNVFEYIPFTEFMFRLNNLLFEILKDIPDHEKIIVFPYGKVGKSGSLVTYPLKNTSSYKKREHNILPTHDIENVKNLSDYKYIIFIDDFIGSGKTFIDEYKKVKKIKNWIDNSAFKGFYLLSAIIMEEGKLQIENAFSEIKIRAEIRNKIFQNGKSPLMAFKNLLTIKTMAMKYGNSLNFVAPLGFDNGQSLVSFFHCTPDNTLPIIWVETKEWNAIYPRESKNRMDEAKEFKKDIAFYIGICNRIGIDVITGQSIVGKIKDKYVRKTLSNTKTAHSIVALLYLKNLGYDNIIICHILGLTRQELRMVYFEAKMKKLIDYRSELSLEGCQFLKELKKKTKKENIRKESLENLTKKTNELYLPSKFKGLT
ncbi:phosphoribosyltransferase-like protein [Flavobacterium hercynium]|uniref:Uncharacterized protein n=1 Tax=Flavobacterium hercynium TaxID=387094 RepID=A0A226HPF8_9FLAO|nr:hypothetical protein [Flavobacterium hercynium]OXA96157.1 hypothetical protein B0A66_00845 [Flavobacterium hercynium]SMP05647.1 hypothetical protein SAMN06265346_101542 [Flavobacterium hercynium]